MMPKQKRGWVNNLKLQDDPAGFVREHALRILAGDSIKKKGCPAARPNSPKTKKGGHHESHPAPTIVTPDTLRQVSPRTTSNPGTGARAGKDKHHELAKTQGRRGRDFQIHQP
jgi:hypothetical protein